MTGDFTVQAYRITHDVTGDAYKRLLVAALDGSSTFSLVWRDQLSFAASAAAVRAALGSLELRDVRRDRWPGTRLVGHYASVVTFRATPDALPVLLEPGALFAWRSPAYPEDLSFSDDRGAVCLATVSHERAGWILSPSLAEAVGRDVRLFREAMSPQDQQYFSAI
jgi:hypothetical protein